MDWLLFIVVLLGLTAVHEVCHVVVARWFGYRPVAWGPVVGGAFVLFDDSFDPSSWPRAYWPLQLTLPWLVTAVGLIPVWLVAFKAIGFSTSAAGQLATSPAMLCVSLLTSAAGSLGDLMLVLAMPRLAAAQSDLTLWDFRLHQGFGARPFFTRHGRQALAQRYGEPAEQAWQRARELPRINLWRLLMASGGPERP